MTEIVAANSRTTVFVGGGSGEWSVVSQRTLSGPPVAAVERVAVISGAMPATRPDASWILQGVSTNDRYTTRAEKTELMNKQAPIGRPEATCAALILLRKKPEWWVLTQDERRAILEEESHHIAIGLRYLPAIARKLLYCRDLGTEQPFDFLGFLDYSPADAEAFDHMLVQLRSTKEWTYMEREIDIRLVKSQANGGAQGSAV